MCGRSRSAGPTSARKVTGTAKSMASPAGIADPATNPAQVARYQGTQTGRAPPKKCASFCGPVICGCSA